MRLVRYEKCPVNEGNVRKCEVDINFGTTGNIIVSDEFFLRVLTEAGYEPVTE